MHPWQTKKGESRLQVGIDAVIARKALYMVSMRCVGRPRSPEMFRLRFRTSGRWCDIKVSGLGKGFCDNGHI